MKKAVLISFLLFFVLFIAKSSANAAGEGSTNLSAEGNAAARDKAAEGQLSAPGTTIPMVNRGTLWDFVCMMGGFNACTQKTSQQTPYLQNSVIGKVSEGIAYVYFNKPADTQMYLADLGQRAGIITPAYAQSIGFSGLSPILGLWKAFRNVAYGFLILVTVAIGFMILFRMKIDPRTVVSIQNALPRIVLTLILITFSYAIAGLFIDFMYLTIFIAITVFRSGVPIPPEGVGNALSYFTGGPLANIYGALYSVHYNSVNSVTNLVGGGVLNIAGALAGAIAGLLVTKATLGGAVPLGQAIGAAGGAALGSGAPNALVSVIVWLAIVFAYLRILIMLISAYIQIILSVIFSPIQLMLGAIPNNDSFTGWVKNLIANLAVFPITSVMLLIGLILSAIASNSGTNNFWVPPGLTGEQSGGASGIIGLGIALTIPSIANAVKEALKSKPAIQAGPGPIFTPVGTLGGLAMQGLSFQYYLRPVADAIKRRVGGGGP